MELPEILEKYRKNLEKTLKPADEIEFSLEDTKPWESKLGGCPYLESLDDYPIGANGRPMIFMAQINFEEMPHIEEFPTKGILQFFVEDSDLYGLDDKCKVIYIEEYIKDEDKLVKKNPFRANYQDMEPFNRPGKMTFNQTQMPVTASVEEFGELFCDEVTEEENDALYDVCYGYGSRVGGYPYFVQGEPPCYRDDECKVLLLQLDMDDTCGIMFGDSGNCTFLISADDLKKRDFSKVEYDWQCC